MKKIILSALFFAAVLSMVFLSSCAVKNTDENGFGFVRLSDGGCGVYAAERMSGEITIPSEYKGEPVTRIEKKFFRNGFDGGNVYVTVPEGVEKINDGAFEDCVQLIRISLPSTLTDIGERAFYSCTSLEKIDIAEGGGVERVGEHAFYFTSIAELPFSNKLKSVGYRAFLECRLLKSIDLSGLEDGYVPGNCFSACSSLNSVILPEGLRGIGESAFSGCISLKSIKIPDGVKEISANAFRGCIALRVAEISQRSELEYVGRNAFSGCGLLSVRLPESIKTSDMSEAFGGCFDIKEVFSDPEIEWWDGITVNSLKKTESVFKTDPDGFVTYMNGDRRELVGYVGNAEKIVVPDGVQVIKRGAFIGSGSTLEIVIPASVTVIEPSAFGAAFSLTAITVDGGNTVFTCRDGVLYSDGGKRLIAYPRGRRESSFTVPDGVGAIGDYAFYGCMLLGVSLPETVTEISEKAFYGCEELFEKEASIRKDKKG